MSGSEGDYEEYEEERRSNHSRESSRSSHHSSHHSDDERRDYRYEDEQQYQERGEPEYLRHYVAPPQPDYNPGFAPGGAAMLGALANGMGRSGHGSQGYDNRAAGQEYGQSQGPQVYGGYQYNQASSYQGYGSPIGSPTLLEGGNYLGLTHGSQGYGDRPGPDYGGVYNQGGYDQGGFGLPSGGPPPGHYEPTGAGFVPSQYGYIAPQPPWGNQRQGPPAQSAREGQPYFEYSTCSGNKKALLIGINYFGSSAQLAGCINDVHNVQHFIVERFGYNPSDIVLLTDDNQDPRSHPTKANILRAMGWLVDGAQKNDSLFFHYSGHGTQVEDVDGDEGDDDDEAICPVDYEEAGLIIDDDSELDLCGHDLLVKTLPAGCRLTAIFDSCHSGTVMDLPYVYTTEGTIKEPSLFENADEHLMGIGKSALSGDSGGLFKGFMDIAKGAFEAKKADEKGKKINTSAADVIQWAGCKDSQTSADTQEEGKATGAMSYAFIAALTKYPNQSYQQLLVSVREEMKGKYTQKPQLSACHPIDTELMFVA